MRHERSNNKNSNEYHIFSVTSEVLNYHLYEALKASKKLNLIIDVDVDRLFEPTLSDVDYSVSLAGSRKARVINPPILEHCGMVVRPASLGMKKVQSLSSSTI